MAQDSPEPAADDEKRPQISVSGGFHENLIVVRSAASSLVLMSGKVEGSRTVVPFSAVRFEGRDDEPVFNQLVALDNLAAIVWGLSKSLNEAAGSLKEQPSVFWPSAGRSLQWMRRAITELDAAIADISSREFIGDRGPVVDDSRSEDEDGD